MQHASQVFAQLIKRSQLICLLGFLTLFTSSSLLHADPALELSAKNLKAPTDSLITAGQPSHDDLEKLQGAGVTTVINLRPLSEQPDYDEKTDVINQGMHYLNIPVAGATDLTQANAAILDKALTEAKGKVFIHCSSGNRVGALLALRAKFIEGKSTSDAIAFGKAAGLTRLEDKVMAILNAQN
jgi:uncharacterized protein (TIGR01244 family)